MSTQLKPRGYPFHISTNIVRAISGLTNTYPRVYYFIATAISRRKSLNRLSLLSVDTITSSNCSLFIASRIEYSIIGFPQNIFIFFPDILLLPPRAVIIAIDLSILIFYPFIKSQWLSQFVQHLFHLPFSAFSLTFLYAIQSHSYTWLNTD